MKLPGLTLMFYLSINLFSINSFGQTIKNNLQTISIAPVNYRVNESDGATLHGYYKKGYNLTIYGDTSAIGFKADCDMDDDWSGAKVQGTTQNTNTFETRFNCKFDPNKLYGTVMPGNDSGQHHYDGFNRVGAGVGDLTVTYRVNKDGRAIDSLIGVVFDRGPQTQPGESSLATVKKLGGNTGNDEYIYIIFPNSAKYLKKVVGTKSNGVSLTRSPTNADFEQAFAIMNSEKSAYLRKSTKETLLSTLSQIPIVTNFDYATKEEKAKGMTEAANDNRNVNE